MHIFRMRAALSTYHKSRALFLYLTYLHEPSTNVDYVNVDRVQKCLLIKLKFSTLFTLSSNVRQFLQLT